MADISHVKIINGTVYDIRDYRVPVLPKSENVYLRGDGTWQIPVSVSGSGVIMVDAGDHLLIKTGS